MHNEEYYWKYQFDTQNRFASVRFLCVSKKKLPRNFIITNLLNFLNRCQIFVIICYIYSQVHICNRMTVLSKMTNMQIFGKLEEGQVVVCQKKRDRRLKKERKETVRLWLIPYRACRPSRPPPPGASGPSEVPLRDLQLDQYHSKAMCVKSSGDNGDTPLIASALSSVAPSIYRPFLHSPPRRLVSIIPKNMFIEDRTEKKLLRLLSGSEKNFEGCLKCLLRDIQVHEY